MNAKMDLNDMLKILGNIYETRMPFNRLLAIRITELTATNVQVRIDMREELVGNFIRNILHGGVISAVLDLTGGLVASVELLKRIEDKDSEEIARRLARIGTIDLRVDYLRAGKGDYFLSSGSVLRQGNKVAVIRTQLCNESNILIAAGTGTYLVS